MSSSRSDMPSAPLSVTAPEAMSRSWFLIAWPWSAGRKKKQRENLGKFSARRRQSKTRGTERAMITNLNIHSDCTRSPGNRLVAKGRTTNERGTLTFHVYALFLPESCAQLLYLGRKPTLHILRRELFMLRGLRRRERPVRRRGDALNERLTPPEVLLNRHRDT